MKTVVALDVHSELCQLVAASEETGEVFLELKVPSTAEDLRGVIGGIAGSKRVVFEEGPLSGMIKDALQGVAEEIVSCDPTRNALIARSEHSNDEVDARRLATLSRAGAVHPVYVPKEPYRTLRSLTCYDRGLAQAITAVKNQIKAICRRCGVRYRGVGVYRGAGRKEAIGKVPSGTARWQIESLYRRLDALRAERVGSHRVLGRQVRKMPIAQRLRSIPGVGPIVARVLVAWLVDPRRFKSRSALSSYAGLGLGQGITNWQPIGRARASRRGQRGLKRVLFIAARVAISHKNALARRLREAEGGRLGGPEGDQRYCAMYPVHRFCSVGKGRVLQG